MKTTSVTERAKPSSAPPIQQQTEHGPFFLAKKESEGRGERGEGRAFFQPTTVQAKMKVGAPDDPFEREADAMADRVVMRRQETGVRRQGEEEEMQATLRREERGERGELQARLLQRQGEEEEEVQAKLRRQESGVRRQEEEEEVQAKLLQRQEAEEELVERKSVRRVEEEEEAVQAKCGACEEEGRGQESGVRRQEEVQATLRIEERGERGELQARLLQRQGEEEEEARRSQESGVRRQEDEEEVQAKLLQRQGEEEEEEVQARLLQRQDEEEEEEARRSQESGVRRQEEEQEELQAKGKRVPIVTKSLETRIQRAKGGGQKLPDKVRAQMEEGLGGDFSGVKVHTGAEGAQLSSELNAQAFTVGNDVFFNKDKFSPGSRDGQHLLAHELAHTMQQGAAIKRKAIVQRESDEVDLAKQLAESARDRQEAIDPQPAEQARQDAASEAVNAQQEAAQDVPDPAPPEVIAPPETPPPVATAAPAAKAPDTLSSDIQPKDQAIGPAGKQLANDSANACQDAANKAQTLANNEQAHDTPDAMVNQAEAAVVPPTEEGQSRANAEQVDTVNTADAPKTDPAAAKSELNQAISDAVPSSVEAMNDFASEGKAQVVGNKVLEETARQTGEVKGTYAAIDDTPAAAPAEPATPVPAQPAPPNTPALNLGEGAVPVLAEEQTNFDNFKEEADKTWEKEGVTPDLQAEIEKVDSGPLGEANQANTELKENVEKQPLAAQEMAQTEQQKVKTEMQQEEEQARKEMDEKRQQELEGAAQEQSKTKSQIELRREEVTKWINTRYEQAKTVVEEKLAKLETQAMTAFDLGQKQLSVAFERNVNRRVDAWKDERYSGLFGGVKWLKDKLVGIDHFPEVKRIFTTEREAFIKGIDRLIAQITKESDEVIQSCKDEVAKAQTEIKEYVDQLAPDLQDVGQKALEETKAKLEALDKKVDEKKEELQKALCDKREAAIAAIDAKIEEMKSEMGGLVAKIGNLLLEAAKKFFTWVLEKAGINPSQLMSIIDKGATVLKAIFTDPIGFFKNIAKAVGGGINQFVTNIVKWLKQGLISWLTGAMGDSGLELPEKFDLKGILFLGLQVAGLTWNVIRARLVKALGASGEAMVSAAEKGVEIISRLIKEGPMALWNIIVEKAAEIKETVMAGIRNWAITQIVKKATIKLVSMLNPAGAIIQAILLLYDTVMFFVENWQRILDFVNSIFNSIGNIARGAVGAAAGFIEKALGQTVPIIISFLARFIGLGGIGKAIRNVIKKIQKPFKKILDKMVKFLVKQVKKIFGKGKKGKKPSKTDVDEAKKDPKKQEKVRKGLADLDKEEKKHLDGGKITQEEAQKVAKKIKAKHKVFKSIKVVDNAGKTWDYKYKASEERTHPGEPQDADKDVLKVGPHTVSVAGENDRQSHHVPSNRLSKTLADFYGAAAGAMKGPDFKDLRDKFNARKTSITTDYPGGNKLSAISLHNKTHKDGGKKGVHRSRLQPDILEEIRTDVEANQTKRVVVFITSGARLAANLFDTHWQSFIAKAFAVEREKEAAAGTDAVTTRATADELIVKVVGGDAKGIQKVARLINSDIKEALEEAKTKSNRQKAKALTDAKTKALRSVNRTANRAYTDSLDNGITAVRQALKANNNDTTRVDGPRQLHESRLTQLRNLAKTTWETNVVGEITI